MKTGKTLKISLLMAVLSTSLASADKGVSLHGHIPHQIQQATKLERVPSDESIQLGLVVQLDQDLLNRTLEELYGPNSPQKKRYLSSSEFAQKFGLEDKRKKLKDFAKANGLTVDPLADQPGSLIVNVKGRAKSVEKVFNVQLHHYRDTRGQVFRSHETDPMIPSTVAPYLNGILGLSNFVGVAHPHIRMTKISSASPSLTKASAKASDSRILTGATGPGGSLAPADIKTIYGLNQTTANGSGQKIAIFELDGYNPADINAYAAAFGLPNPTLTFVGVDGTTNLCGGSNCTTQNPNFDNGMIEVALDIELVAALAPSASKIYVYDGPNTNQGVLDTYNAIATDNLASAVSTSWGLSELYAGVAAVQSENLIFQRMAVQGQSIYAASGDNGAYDNGVSLTVDDPASQPYVTAVGGTTLSGSVQSPAETTWYNASNGTGSGGGVSAIWPLPSYQLGVAGKASTQFRNVPDVALNADPASGYAVYVGGGWWQVGGTSAAAPLWAGLTSLINQKRAGAGYVTFGFANPLIYQLGTSSSYSTNMKDILTGNNGFYNAGPGYDNATGWGSFKGGALLTWSTQLPTVVISSPTLGQNLAGVVTLTGTATSSAFQSYKVEYAASTSPTSFTLIGSAHTTPVQNGTLETWNTSALPVGIYSLKLTLTDTAAQTYSTTVSTLYIDRAPPTVMLVTPADNSTVIANQTFTITVNASDDVAVQSVKFDDNGTAGPTLTVAPYSYFAQFTTVGMHIETVTATDVVGKKTSMVFLLNVVADTVAPTAPTGVTLTGLSQTSLFLGWVGATDNVAVTGYRVDVATDASFTHYLPTYQNRDIGINYGLSITGLQTQTLYYARVRAYDAAGNTSVNSTVAQGTTPEGPGVVIVSPANNASLTGVITMSGTASSPAVPGLNRVELSADNRKLGQAVGTTNWTFALDTDLIGNGIHTLTAEAFDNTGFSAVTSIQVTISNPNQASFDTSLKVPFCGTQAPLCDTGALLTGRGNLFGGPELHQPNTLQNSCFDGDSGTYHIDESNERLRVSTVDGTNLAPGKIVKVEATEWVYASYNSDHLDLYYAANADAPVWTYLGTLQPTASGTQILSSTYTLPSGNRQAVRARFRFGSGNPAPCGIGAFDDQDDLAFATSSDAVLPSISITAPIPGASVSHSVDVAATASDNVGVTKVEFYADGFLRATLTAAPYHFNWDTTLVGNGSHILTAKAYDAANNVGEAAPVSVNVANFTDTTPPTLEIISPQVVPGSVFFGFVAVQAVAADNVAVDRVEFIVDNQLQATSTAPPYQFTWNTFRFRNGFHTLMAQAVDTSGNIGYSTQMRLLTYNVSTTGTDASAGAPAPNVHLPATLAVNGTLSANYDPSYGNVVFVWEFDPQLGTVASAEAPKGVTLTAAPFVTWTTDHNLNLSSLALTPGNYQLWVAAVLPDDSASASVLNTVTLTPAAGLAVQIYPNPWRAARADPPVTFDQVPPGSTIKIYTISADWIRTLEAPNGSASWNLQNDSGGSIASGIYLYVVTDPQGQTSHGKLAVIR